MFGPSAFCIQRGVLMFLRICIGLFVLQLITQWELPLFQNGFRPKRRTCLPEPVYYFLDLGYVASFLQG